MQHVSNAIGDKQAPRSSSFSIYCIMPCSRSGILSIHDLIVFRNYCSLTEACAEAQASPGTRRGETRKSPR